MERTCRHCGTALPVTSDAFCAKCGEEVDSPRIAEDSSFAPLTSGEDLGLRLVGPALALPILAGIVLCFVTSFGLSLAISASTVVITAVLVATDASFLGEIDRAGEKQGSAAALFLGMILLWIVFYPFAFFRRRKFAGPSLAVPAALSASFFVVAPLIKGVLVPPGLPTCSSPEVVQLIEQIVRQTPVGAKIRSIDGHREASYDAAAARRLGQCVVHLDDGDIIVNYTVRWRDQAAGQFEVSITPPDLPSCTSREVVQLLDKLIRGTPVGGKAEAIDNHQEIRHEPTLDRREGRCIVRVEGQEIPVTYFVQWRDRNQGKFEVRLAP